MGTKVKRQKWGLVAAPDGAHWTFRDPAMPQRRVIVTLERPRFPAESGPSCYSAYIKAKHRPRKFYVWGDVLDAQALAMAVLNKAPINTKAAYERLMEDRSRIWGRTLLEKFYAAQTLEVIATTVGGNK